MVGLASLKAPLIKPHVLGFPGAEAAELHPKPLSPDVPYPAVRAMTTPRAWGRPQRRRRSGAGMHGGAAR